MKIYLDYFFIINMLFDLIILVALSIVLKRNIRFKRIVLGSIFGGFSSFILFLKIDDATFFILKIVTGIIMIITTFNYRNIKYTFNNFINLMLISIVLGGSLYLFNINEENSLYFFVFNKELNLFLLLIISILIIFVYVKISKKYQRHFNKCYRVDVYINNKIYKYNAYLDTGNYLSYFNKPVLLISKYRFKFNNIIYVPYKSLNNNGIIECMKINKIYIHDIGYKYNILIGKSIDKFNMEGIDMLLNERILE